jgi:hypothetical protein
MIVDDQQLQARAPQLVLRVKEERHLPKKAMVSVPPAS